MTPPRECLPRETVFVTCRAVSRALRFVPTREVVETIWFVLAYVASRFDVAIHEFCWMSNHYHLVLTTGDDGLPAFMGELNALLSRALNALRGWSGTNIEKGYNVTKPQDAEAVLGHAAYTLANPCAAHLVGRAAQWKGVTSVGLRYGEVITIKRPRVGLWAAKRAGRRAAMNGRRAGFAGGRSGLPEVVGFALVRPPVGGGVLDDDGVRAEVVRRTAALEEKAEAARRRRGIGVMGMRRCRAQHWNDLPGRAEELFRTNPTVSGRSKWARIEALQRRRVFLDGYARARDAWIGGDREVVFPAGTWLMRRRFQVRCAGPPL